MSAARAIRFLLALGLGAGSLSAQSLVPEGTDFHNGASLPLAAGESTRELLDRLDEALALSNADEVAHVLRALRRDPTDQLVPLGPRTLVPALDLAARRVMAAEAEGLRARILEETQLAVAEALAARDLDALIDHATRGTAMPSAHTAAGAAARLCFEAGRWWEAEVFGRRAGLEALAGVAAERKRQPSQAAAWPGPWSAGNGLLYDRISSREPIITPQVLEPRPGELVIVTEEALHGFDAAPKLGATNDVVSSFNPFSLFEVFEGLELLIRPSLPAPRRQDFRGPVDALVSAFNTPGANRRRSPREPRQARVLSVDLSGSSPRRRWLTELSETPSRDNGYRSAAVGTPLVVADRVFTQLHHVGARTRVELVALSLESGELLFRTPLVEAEVVPRFASRIARFDSDELDKRGGKCGLLVAEGLVYVDTGSGVFAAVDALSGRVRFAFRYDRLFSLDQDTYARAYLFDTGGWVDEPVRRIGERLLVAPNDSRYLYELALQPGPEGQLMLGTPLERLGRRHVGGSRPDPRDPAEHALLFTRRSAGRYGVELSGRDGRILEQSPAYSAREEITGRPVQVAGRLLVPTRFGVRVHELADLTAEPRLLVPPPLSRPLPVRRLIALPNRLVALCHADDEDSSEVQVVWWDALRDVPSDPRRR